MAALINLAYVRSALALNDFDSATALQRMAPAPRGWRKRDYPPHPAAVMILIYRGHDGVLYIALTLRAAELRGHSGQVSFPGGRQDPGDESLTATARRETREEIGVYGERLSVLGHFPRFYIPASHHDICPTVAYFDGAPAFVPNSDEVAEIFSFALEDLLRPRFKYVEQRRIRGTNVRVPYYEAQGHKVWGATAMLLSELEQRLRLVLPQSALRELS